ncbi:MAG: cell division protein ZapE [Paraglaciecola sp.]|uniref:cell division protein ZapE n=1 Tax=Paraglaciecola sp. TaxID=1920173 RepID=UPI00329693FC
MSITSQFNGVIFINSQKKQSPFQVYQSLLGKTLVSDLSQFAAIQALDELFGQVTSTTPQTRGVVRGVYLWGDVGRGKTFLMDLFYQCLAGEAKQRLHFHRFMARVHQDLHELSGEENPLNSIAENLAKNCRVLCFDEFFVSDIGDAMILAGLFERLFALGVVLVATSNIPIERLYENGLARHKFLPFIALLQQYTQAIHLDGQQDHRLTSFKNMDTRERPTNIGLVGELDFQKIFTDLTQNFNDEKASVRQIIVCNRSIPVVLCVETRGIKPVVWFDFKALCDGHRSQLDYMEIANRFTTVLLSDVPYLGGEVRGWIKARGTEDGVGENQALSTGGRKVEYASSDNSARRFISLIDELYDQNVTLYMSSDVPLAELYQDGALLFEFRRTYSRLIELSRL